MKKVTISGVCGSLLVFLLLLLLMPPALGAAQEASNTDVPDKTDVMQFLTLMHVREQMVQVLGGMSKAMREGAEESFKQKVPDATAEQLARLDKICDTIFSSMPVDEMVDAIVPIYQKHLTKSDLAAITAFYSSPVGQKILKELPAITAEAMQAGQEIGRRAVAAKTKELDEQMTELVKESKKQ